MIKKIIISISMFMATIGHSAPVEMTAQNTIVLRGEVNTKSISNVIRQLTESDEKELNLFITSGGGSIIAGNQLVYALQTTNKKVTCIANVAASMAFIILQACQERVVLPHSILMQHVASYSIEGDAPNNHSRVKFINQMIDKLDEAQAKRLGLSLKEFRAKTRNDWWLFGENAVEANAADRVGYVSCSPELAKSRIKETYQVLIFTVDIEWSACPLIEYPLKIGDEETFVKIGKSPRAERALSNLLKSLDVRSTVNLWLEKKQSN